MPDELDLESVPRNHNSKTKKKKEKKEKKSKQSRSEGGSDDSDGGGPADEEAATEGGTSKERDPDAKADEEGGNAAEGAARDDVEQGHSADSDSASDDDDDGVDIDMFLCEGSPRALVAFQDPVLTIIDKVKKKHPCLNIATTVLLSVIFLRFCSTVFFIRLRNQLIDFKFVVVFLFGQCRKQRRPRPK